MKILSTVFLIFAVWFNVLYTTGCPAETSVRKAARASYQVSALTLDAVRATKKAYEDGIITLQQKDALADKLIILSKGGQAFNAAVRQANELYKSGREIPPDQLEILEKLFDEAVVVPFLEFLRELRIVDNVPQLAAVIKLLGTTVLTIARAFGRETVVARNHAPPSETTAATAHKVERILFDRFNKGATIYG